MYCILNNNQKCPIFKIVQYNGICVRILHHLPRNLLIKQDEFKKRNSCDQVNIICKFLQFIPKKINYSKYQIREENYFITPILRPSYPRNSSLVSEI